MSSQKSNKSSMTSIKKWLPYLLPIAIIYVGWFFTEKFGMAQEHQLIINAFISSGVIGIITTIILIYQSHVQTEQAKKQEVFKAKMTLYSDIIKEMEEIKLKGILGNKEKLKILSMQSRIGILSNLDTLHKFLDFQNKLTVEGKDEISEEYPDILLEFIHAAREDLEVHPEMSNNERKLFKDIEKESKKVAKTYSGSYQKTNLINWEGFAKKQKDKGNISDKTEKMAEYIYNVIKKEGAEKLIKGSPSYTPNSITFKRMGDRSNKLTIKTTKKDIRIEHAHIHYDKEIDKHSIPHLDEKCKELSDLEIGHDGDNMTAKFATLEALEECKDSIVGYFINDKSLNKLKR